MRGLFVLAKFKEMLGIPRVQLDTGGESAGRADNEGLDQVGLALLLFRWRLRHEFLERTAERREFR